MSLHPLGFIEPCLPTVSRIGPTGPQWAYEIKHDGFRFICHRDGERVRVFSRTGHDWSTQLPAIVAALRALPIRSVIVDGEGVICGPDGASDFDRLRACFQPRRRAMHSCMHSMCWSWTAAICADNAGTHDALC
jgi:bifunctional non-homologous end joining protein LigD